MQRLYSDSYILFALCQWSEWCSANVIGKISHLWAVHGREYNRAKGITLYQPHIFACHSTELYSQWNIATAQCCVPVTHGTEWCWHTRLVHTTTFHQTSNEQLTNNKLGKNIFTLNSLGSSVKECTNWSSPCMFPMFFHLFSLHRKLILQFFYTHSVTMKRDAMAAFYTISCVPRVFQFLLPQHAVRNALHMLVHLSYLTLVFINKVPDHHSKERRFLVWSVSLSKKRWCTKQTDQISACI